MEKELLEHNLRLLEEQVRKAGIPEDAMRSLRDKVRAGMEQAFYIPFGSVIDGKPVKGELYVEQAAGQQLYAWKTMHLDLGKNSRALLRENGFPLGNGYDMTLREAFNLMEGRYVYREPPFDLDRRGYWVVLDLVDYHAGHAKLEYYQTDGRLERVLADAPLGRYLTPDQKKNLVDSLKEGNRQELTLEVMGTPKKVWAEFIPGLERIQLQDARGVSVHLKPGLSENVSERTTLRPPERALQRYSKGRSR